MTEDQVTYDAGREAPLAGGGGYVCEVEGCNAPISDADWDHCLITCEAHRPCAFPRCDRRPSHPWHECARAGKHEPYLICHPYQPPARPSSHAGEGEQWELLPDSSTSRPEDYRCRRCGSVYKHDQRHKHPDHAARPSSPTGETPETAEMTAFLDEPCSVCGRTWRQDNPGGNKRSSRYARRHWHQIKHGHSFRPTEETPCATCGLGADPDCPCGANEGRHAEHECDTGDAHPYAPTGETAGQGIEEAWTRIEETRDNHGVEVALWQQSRPTWTDIRAVPIAVEDEIARQFALEQYGLLKTRAERAAARATAAEAERDRLREANERLTEAVRGVLYKHGCWVGPNQDGIGAVGCGYCRAARRLLLPSTAALAGESRPAPETEAR